MVRSRGPTDKYNGSVELATCGDPSDKSKLRGEFRSNQAGHTGEKTKAARLLIEEATAVPGRLHSHEEIADTRGTRGLTAQQREELQDPELDYDSVYGPHLLTLLRHFSLQPGAKVVLDR